MREHLSDKLYLSAFVLLACVLGYYQIIRGDYFQARAINNYLRVLPNYAIRGTIFDRNGIAIAYDRPSYNIAVIPYQIRKHESEIFTLISKLSALDQETLKNNFYKGKANQFSPVDIIEDADKISALKIKEALGSDVIINVKPQRYYPYPEEFAHMLGYVKEATALYEKLKIYGYTPLERAGFVGVEQYYDSYLKGANGGRLIEINSSGKTVGYLGDEQAEKGYPLTLTIDSQIQKIAFKALNGNTGSLILMDARSGEIIALVSYPSFNPNYLVKGKRVGAILNNPSKPLLNRAIQSRYPIGSTFKPISAAAALEEKKITVNTTFNCNGSFFLGKTIFKCWSVHGMQDLVQALAHSCNVYFYNVGKILGPQLMSKWSKAFGLDSLTEIDLPYETKSIIPSEQWKRSALNQEWVMGDTINFSIGQGYVSVTPIALLLAANVFASDGFLLKPTVLKNVKDLASAPSRRRYVGISKNNLNTVKQGLIAVAQSDTGTARLLSFVDLKLAGKTGTAQTGRKAHGWFIGFFPYDHPKYSICTMLEYAGSGYEAVKVTHSFLKQLKEENLLNYD